jgi:hypothetical protein
VGRPVLGIGLLGHDFFVYGALAMVAGVWWLLYRTRFGLRLRAAGENPAMVDAAGVSVLKMRYAALALNGVLSALAGSYLVLALTPSFIPNMTAGRGYMALAAMIFGKWHPVGALAACLLFGFLEAAAIRLQGVVLPGIGQVPVQGHPGPALPDDGGAAGRLHRPARRPRRWARRTSRNADDPVDETLIRNACSTPPCAARLQAYAPVLQLPRRRRAARRAGPHPRRLQRRERRLPAGRVRRGGRAVGTGAGRRHAACSAVLVVGAGPRPARPAAAAGRSCASSATTPAGAGGRPHRCCARFTLGQLLPHSFGPDHLKDPRA